MTKKQSKKIAQEAINNEVKLALSKYQDEISEAYSMNNWKQLYNCNATTIQTENLYILKSYNTIIAFIERSSNIAFYFIDIVYSGKERTTSRQHFSKFIKQYECMKSKMVYPMIYRPI